MPDPAIFRGSENYIPGKSDFVKKLIRQSKAVGK